ncbi:replication endonuclease [Vibrio splendidus]|uniref:replication endonuclease n=1 Tax=Vibrio splendidus TaxID=29497 RepID=UPI001E5676B5|nr:replication endonuclease [Vibrio splendidus]MCC4787703.1 replication endonuclease [Vibrio splendidus]
MKNQNPLAIFDENDIQIDKLIKVEATTSAIVPAQVSYTADDYYIPFLDDSDENDSYEFKTFGGSEEAAIRKVIVRDGIKAMSSAFRRIMEADKKENLNNENFIKTRDRSLDEIDFHFKCVFPDMSARNLKTHFNPKRFFEQSEQNTRDAGEELCVYTIYLLTECAREENVYSFRFRRNFRYLIEENFTKNLHSFFKKTNHKTHIGRHLRLIDRATCRNRFNKIVKESLLFDDMCLKNLGSKKSEIAKSRQKYASFVFSEYAGQRSIEKRVQQLEYRDDYLKSRYIRDGKTAFDLMKKDSAKAAEAYLEMLGMEEIAKELGYIFLFITLTCPPEYHSNSTRGGKKSKWKAYSARESHEFLQEQYRKLGKSFDKEIGMGLRFGIENGGAFGKKVVEPHKDGTAHWHIILFCKPSKIERYKELFMHFFSRKSKNNQSYGCEIREQGKDEFGNKIKGNEASPASYILKYMQKTQNIRMEDGNIIDDNNIAVDAWKHATRIRTQSNFGINGTKTKFTQCRALANKNRDLFFDMINKEDCDRKYRKSLGAKERKLAFIKELRRSNINVLDLSGAEKIRERVTSRLQDYVLKRAKREFIRRAISEEVDVSKFQKFSQIKQYFKLALKLINVIKTSSAKTKETKTSILSRNIEKKQRVFGTDYKKFMELSAQLTYLKIDVQNRFEEIVTRNSHIGTGNLHINLA